MLLCIIIVTIIMLILVIDTVTGKFTRVRAAAISQDITSLHQHLGTLVRYLLW